MIAWSIEALVSSRASPRSWWSPGAPTPGSSCACWATAHEYGIDLLSYAYQEKPGGIAEALGLAERFVDGDPVLVMLADNIVERSIRPTVERFRADQNGRPHPALPGGGARAPPPSRRARAR